MGRALLYICATRTNRMHYITLNLFQYLTSTPVPTSRVRNTYLIPHRTQRQIRQTMYEHTGLKQRLDKTRSPAVTASDLGSYRLHHYTLLCCISLWSFCFWCLQDWRSEGSAQPSVGALILTWPTALLKHSITFQMTGEYNSVSEVLSVCSGV